MTNKILNNENKFLVSPLLRDRQPVFVISRQISQGTFFPLVLNGIVVLDGTRWRSRNTEFDATNYVV